MKFVKLLHLFAIITVVRRLIVFFTPLEHAFVEAGNNWLLSTILQMLMYQVHVEEEEEEMWVAGGF